MRHNRLLPVLIGLMVMGAPVVGMADTGTPVSMKTPMAPATSESVPGEASAARSWDAVVVTDTAEMNHKTAYYKVKTPSEKRIGNGRLAALFPGTLPEGLREELAYTRYPVGKDYLIHLGGGTLAVKAEPRFGAATVRTIGRFQHIATDGMVLAEASPQTGHRDWYRVVWGEGDAKNVGYVFGTGVTRRAFQFSKMLQSVTRLRAISESGDMAHVDNYKNRAGWAPARQGQNVDDYGVLRDQSAPLYYQPDTQGDFRYLTDGSLVRVLSELEGFYEVDPVDVDGVFYMPKKYLHRDNVLQVLSKAVVVDRNFQNEAVFEYDNGWKLISYQLATTGENAPFKQETSLGNFMVVEKKSRFMYLGDISKVIEGYAPFALRFNGGAYIHGVPVNFKEVRSRVVVQPAVLDELGNVLQPAVTRDVVVGRQDPGMQEFLSTIGTTPRSHKCVRNYTSHAQFLYQWAEIGNTAVVVID